LSEILKVGESGDEKDFGTRRLKNERCAVCDGGFSAAGGIPETVWLDARGVTDPERSQSLGDTEAAEILCLFDAGAVALESTSIELSVRRSPSLRIERMRRSRWECGRAWLGESELVIVGGGQSEIGKRSEGIDGLWGL
jgi:hypothetical protein